MPSTSARPGPRGLAVHLRGHLLLFDGARGPAYDPRAGPRLLLVVAGIEGARVVLQLLHVPLRPLWLVLPLHVVLAVLMFRFVARVRRSEIGFRPWREWGATERSYFVQTLILLNLVFPAVFGSRLSAIAARPAAGGVFMGVFVPYFFYGVYQEVAYRGAVQSELVRRWGAPLGILAANVLYTFGPLHFNHFSSRLSVAAPMFAAIFAVGLFLGLMFRRSGNLWLPAIFHGVANAYIVGSLGG